MQNNNWKKKKTDISLYTIQKINPLWEVIGNENGIHFTSPSETKVIF